MWKQVTKSHDGSQSAFPGKEIYDLCRKRVWQKVVRQCQSNPVDAQYQGEEGTPLHVACKFQPSVRVVRALLDAFPAAAAIPNAKSELPLHEACRCNASISVIRELTKDNPASACFPPSAVTTLYNARDTTETNMEANNRAVLWHTKQADLQQANYSSIFWQKVQVLLEAVATHRQTTQHQSTRVLFILHAAVSLGLCPAEVLFYCFSQYPEQIRMRDGCGRLPLHIAVMSAALGSNSNDSSILGKLQLRELSVILRLLDIYPDAARLLDPNEPAGRYPMHTALANGHEWHGGVKELFQHCPESVKLQDPVEGFYPFQLATHDLDSVFQLLRSMPSVLLNVRVKPDCAAYQEPPVDGRKMTRSESMSTKTKVTCLFTSEEMSRDEGKAKNDLTAIVGGAPIGTPGRSLASLPIVGRVAVANPTANAMSAAATVVVPRRQGIFRYASAAPMIPQRRAVTRSRTSSACPRQGIPGNTTPTTTVVPPRQGVPVNTTSVTPLVPRRQGVPLNATNVTPAVPRRQGVPRNSPPPQNPSIQRIIAACNPRSPQTRPVMFGQRKQAPPCPAKAFHGIPIQTASSGSRNIQPVTLPVSNGDQKPPLSHGLGQILVSTDQRMQAYCLDAATQATPRPVFTGRKIHAEPATSSMSLVNPEFSTVSDGQRSPSSTTSSTPKPATTVHHPVSNVRVKSVVVVPKEYPHAIPNSRNASPPSSTPHTMVPGQSIQQPVTVEQEKLGRTRPGTARMLPVTHQRVLNDQSKQKSVPYRIADPVVLVANQRTELYASSASPCLAERSTSDSSKSTKLIITSRLSTEQSVVEKEDIRDKRRKFLDRLASKESSQQAEPLAADCPNPTATLEEHVTTGQIGGMMPAVDHPRLIQSDVCVAFQTISPLTSEHPTILRMRMPGEAESSCSIAYQRPRFKPGQKQTRSTSLIPPVAL